MKGYIRLRRIILERLDHLSPSLTYHAKEHTLDVLNVCNDYVRRFKLDSHTAKLLRIAALSHDMGFLKHHKDHEEISVKMVTEMMEDLHFERQDIDQVALMIMATKIGNTTHSLLEKIISDADLDYLGRDDFPEISNQLYKEFLHQKIVSDYDSWMRLQLNFLDDHSFKTEFAQKNRAPKKDFWVRDLKDSYNS